jgi:hypothetical protein
VVVQQAARAPRAFQTPVALHSVMLISHVEAAQRAGLVMVEQELWQLLYMSVQDRFAGRHPSCAAAMPAEPSTSRRAMVDIRVFIRFPLRTTAKLG